VRLGADFESSREPEGRRHLLPPGQSLPRTPGCHSCLAGNESLRPRREET
jgi:hypothetical protein